MKKQKVTTNKTTLVHAILLAQAETRHNNRALCAAFWRVEQKNVCKFANADTFLRMFIAGDFTEAEVITRIKRRLQTQYPELKQ